MWERQRCVENYLQLNVGKAKDIFHLRRNQREKSGIEIKGETDERVKLYKNLEITFGGKLSWKRHVHVVVKKVHNRLYCLRKLRPLMSAKIFYRCFIQLPLAVF